MKGLSSHFIIKDKTKFEHQHDLVYLGHCQENNCAGNYIGETTRKELEWIIDHNGGDTVFSIISAAHLSIHTEISVAPLISATPLNAALIRIVTIFY